jgi:hydrocephalus-inducing protein
MADDETAVVSPSQYLRQAQMTSEELLRHAPFLASVPPPRVLEFLDMSSLSSHRDSAASVDRPLFDPMPGEVRFQQFEPLRTYELPLLLRNVDTVARRVKVAQSLSPHFRIIPPKDQTAKIAAGMQTQYLVRFTPDQAKDYTDEIVCVTEREKFAIQVRAIGPRAILDLPDTVHFDPCPVKLASAKVRRKRRREDNQLACRASHTRTHTLIFFF